MIFAIYLIFFKFYIHDICDLFLKSYLLNDDKVHDFNFNDIDFTKPYVIF